MNKLRKDFDLPTNHLRGQKAYVPPKARTSTEIERRHDMPHGSLILEQQHLGSKIGEFLLSRVEEPEDVSFVTRLLAIAELATSEYTYGQTEQVMRRRLATPILVFGFNEAPLSEGDMLLRAGYQLDEASDLSRKIVTSHKLSELREKRLKFELGRLSGNTALSLNCVGLSGQLESVSMYAASELARTSCLGLLSRTRVMSAELGCPPSIAQLPDPDSELAVHIRRTAPNNVFEAYDEAASKYAIAR
jgi:hypothetical protein